MPGTCVKLSGTTHRRGVMCNLSIQLGSPCRAATFNAGMEPVENLSSKFYVRNA